MNLRDFGIGARAFPIEIGKVLDPTIWLNRRLFAHLTRIFVGAINSTNIVTLYSVALPPREGTRLGFFRVKSSVQLAGWTEPLK